MSFAFELNQEVSINSTGEVGTIVGRTEYVADLDFENYYYISIADSDGCIRQTWRPESAISVIVHLPVNSQMIEAVPVEDEEL